jgi:hypothetical protein
MEVLRSGIIRLHVLNELAALPYISVFLAISPGSSSTIYITVCVVVQPTIQYLAKKAYIFYLYN